MVAEAPRGRGRPRIQAAADDAVAAVLAGAGATIDGPAWSTRSLAELTGLSQTVVSRSIRRLAGGVDSRGADSSSRSERPLTALALSSIEVSWSVCQTGFVLADPHDAASGPRVHLRRRAAFMAAVKMLGATPPDGLVEDLRATVEVPLGALAALAEAAAQEGGIARWDGGGSSLDVPTALNKDSFERFEEWLPRASVSVTEMLAVRLRDAIIVSDLRPGDRLTTAYVARLLDVSRSVAADVLRRMVDDELLDGSRGDVRIPLASAVDVIELYAARMMLGEIILRAAAARPRRYLLQPRRVLDAIADAAAAGVNAGDADLRFQQEVARASGLEQTVRLFESSTVRVRMLIAVLRMDYARTAHSILADDRRILAALVAGDGEAAVRAWRRKTDEAVRHMHGRAQHAAFDVALWRRLTAL